MRFAALAGVLLAALAPVWAGAATPATAAESTCDGVWVVVDYGNLGGTRTACAAKHGTGAEALRSAGFSPTIADGFLEKIEGKPGNPDPNKAYWSYWQATITDDGSYTAWKYSNLGVTASHPRQGNAEGWRYQSLEDGKVAPAPRPPDGEASTPTPKPSATKPSATPTKKPTATRSPTASASRSAAASATPTPTRAPSTAAATPTTASPTTSEVAADEVVTPTALDDVAPTPTDDPGGSPVGAIIAGAAVLAAGAGLGGWWLWRGRKP